MNDIKDVIIEIERLDPPYPHSFIPSRQVLDAKAVLLGYSSLSNLIAVLENLPEHEYYSEYRKIFQKICAIRMPDNESKYFQFYAHGNDEFSYESIWVGRGKDNADIREPRLLNGRSHAIRHRSLSSQSIYVINSELELGLWSHAWFGFALIKEDLARGYFFEFFVKG